MQFKLLFFLFTLFFKFLGTTPPQTAIILLQNHYEIRATGGFMGSYAKVGFSSVKGQTLKGAATAAGPLGHQAEGGSDLNGFSLSLHDIYVPDGQIQGHVEPPTPIQQAFGQGWFRLRDANWDPNFPTSANTIRWFLEKGDEINPDILIALNLSTIQKLLTITGPIEVQPPMEVEPLTSNNISLLLQNNIQQNFFPGSTNKKDLLTAINQTFLEKLSQLTFKQKIKIIRIIVQDLKNGEILINSTDPKLQAWLEKKDWAGQLKPPRPSTSEVEDFVAIIESNLGSNKANQFVTRHTTHQVTSGSELSAVCNEVKDSSEPCSTIHHQITIDYQNSSPSKSPNPPHHHGGDYLNYIRFYIPTTATDVQVTSGSELSAVCNEVKDSSEPCSVKTTTTHNFTEIGFFHTTPHQATSSITISYNLPLSKDLSSDGFTARVGRFWRRSSDVRSTKISSYQLTLLKQPGIENSPQTINLFNQTIEDNLQQDFIIKSALSSLI